MTRFLVFLLRLPFALVRGILTFVWVLILGGDGDDADADQGRRLWLGRHHPQSHTWLPRPGGRH